MSTEPFHTEPPTLGADPGGPEAWQRLYDDLRGLAKRMLQGERANHTLQPTALVHEAWLRLAKADGKPSDPSMFRRMAARTMRRALVDHARRRGAQKRGIRAQIEIELSDEVGVPDPRPAVVDLLALDEAIDHVAASDPTLARSVELRVFAAASFREIGEALGCSESQAHRNVQRALEMLRSRLSLP